MAFCSNCGFELPEGVKYCPQCGTPSINATRQGKTKYEGEIHKCPNCGEVLGAFVAVCPSCGYELRGASASSVVSSFAKKIEEIEHGEAGAKMSARAREKQIVSLVRNFVIPNRYDTSQVMSASKKAVSDAWESMFEQAYQKAQISFGNSPDFSLFSSIYEEKKEIIAKQQKKSKKHLTLSWVLLFGGLLLLIVVPLIMSKVLSNNNTRIIETESTRLNAIVQEVYSYIEEENYTMARAKTTELVFDLSKSSSSDCQKAAEKWDATRAELVEIIDSAEANKSTNGSAP